VNEILKQKAATTNKGEEGRTISTSLRRAYESPKQEPEHDSKSEDGKNNNNVDGDERMISKNPKRGQTSKGWDMALQPENEPSTSKVDGVVVVLTTNTRMIGAFAVTKESSGGIYPSNSQLHYFPAHCEVYKSWREVELLEEEYENWKNPKKHAFIVTTLPMKWWRDAMSCMKGKNTRFPHATVYTKLVWLI
jgi:hypothetical protein